MPFSLAVDRAPEELHARWCRALSRAPFDELRVNQACRIQGQRCPLGVGVRVRLADARGTESRASYLNGLGSWGRSTVLNGIGDWA